MKNKLLIFIIFALTILSINNFISFIFFYSILSFLIMMLSCSSLSNIDNYKHFYLINQDKEYLNILILNNNYEYGTIYYSDNNNNVVEYKIKKLNKLDGSFKSETIDGKKLNGYLPNKNSGFEGSLNNQKVHFDYPGSYISETNILQYNYSNHIGKATLKYEISLFLLNNPNSIKAIDIINSNINKEYGITETVNIKDQKEIYDIIETTLNNNMQKHFHELGEKIGNEESIYYIKNTIPNITFINDDLISISSDNILKNAVYYLNSGEQLKINYIIADTNKCIEIIRSKMLDNKKIIENKKFNINNISLEKNYFYITPNGIVFNWLLHYKDNIINKEINYVSVFLEAKEINDVISNKFKKIFN